MRCQQIIFDIITCHYPIFFILNSIQNAGLSVLLYLNFVMSFLTINHLIRFQKSHTLMHKPTQLAHRKAYSTRSHAIILITSLINLVKSNKLVYDYVYLMHESNVSQIDLFLKAFLFCFRPSFFFDSLISQKEKCLASLCQWDYLTFAHFDTNQIN